MGKSLSLPTQARLLELFEDGGDTSGAKSVSWHAGCRKWLVQLSINRQYKYGGVYTNYADACAVANRLRAEHHSAYARR